jgi:hypothetical protein
VPLFLIETAPRRIRYLADRAISPTLENWEAMPLPASLFPLYFLTRPFRLAFANAKKITRPVNPREISSREDLLEERGQRFP